MRAFNYGPTPRAALTVKLVHHGPIVRIVSLLISPCGVEAADERAVAVRALKFAASLLMLHAEQTRWLMASAR
ncbi:hypothetical protein [Streptomyces anulatus]|uniref:hypothetical protein n=1 Tax=Streptomyces anulatus TaxID=1892 RepID=UPI00331FE0B5